MKCKICNKQLKKGKEYCINECFLKYINSKEFNKELNEALSIKNTDGKKGDNI